MNDAESGQAEEEAVLDAKPSWELNLMVLYSRYLGNTTLKT